MTKRTNKENVGQSNIYIYITWMRQSRNEWIMIGYTL